MKSLNILALAAVLVAVSGCTAKESASPKSDTAESGAHVAVAATDTACTLSAAEGAPGATDFVVTNGGSKVTEVYVYGSGGQQRVLGEAENIPPGVQRTLTVSLDSPGAYTVACKPGMVGDGISSTYAVKG